jgi:NET1-associated nuclear protein 1 (U3 small nucleolar RNA-associated protein 17)
LILAYNTSLQVYSAPESLLLRNIQLSLTKTDGRKDQIAAVCPSVTSPNLLWVASYGGVIWLVDWTTGAGPKAHISLGCDRLSDLSVVSTKIGNSVRDILYISTRKEEAWFITAYDIRDHKILGSKPIFSCASPIENIRTVHLGHVFAAYSGRTIILGTRTQDVVSTFEHLAYEVVTLDASDEITCLDMQVTTRIHLNRKSQLEASDALVVDIAIGCARGAIFAYSDLLPKLRSLNKQKPCHHILHPRKYHWHRKAVHAVKWSRDGKGNTYDHCYLC